MVQKRGVEDQQYMLQYHRVVGLNQEPKKLVYELFRGNLFESLVEVALNDDDDCLLDVVLAVVVGLVQEFREGLEGVLLSELLHLAGVFGSREDVGDQGLAIGPILLKLEVLPQTLLLPRSCFPHPLVYLLVAELAAVSLSHLIYLLHVLKLLL